MLRSIIGWGAGLLRRFLSHPLLKRVIRNTGYLFSAQTVAAALSMGQGILTARLLGVEGAGLVGIITQFSSNVNRLLSFRMSELVVSYVGEYTAAGRTRHAAALYKTAALVEVVASIIAYGLIVVLASLGAQIFAKDVSLAPLFALYGLAILANFAVESSTGLLQFFDRFKWIAYLTVGQSLLTIALIANAFLSGGGLREIIIAYMLGKVVWGFGVTSVSMWAARKEWGAGWWKAPVRLLEDRRRDLVRFAVSTNISGTLTLITRDSDELWLGAFTSPLQAGYYKIAKAIINIILIPVNPLISTTYREVANEVANRRWVNVRYLLRSGSLISAAWTLPASLGLVVFGRWVIGLYGPEFLPTSYISLLIMLVGVIAVNIFYWNRSVLLPLGRPDYPTKVQAVAAVIKVAGIILLVPTLGAIGMAIMLSAMFLFSAVVLVWKTYSEIRRAEVRGLAGGGS